MEEEYPFLKTFDGKIISGRKKLAKPDPAIIQLEKKFYLTPKETFYIDDWIENFNAVQ